MLEVRHICGLDLGQVNDFTALVSLRREQEVPEPPKPRVVDPEVQGWEEILNPPRPDVAAKQPAKYYCNIAERFERGSAYPDLAKNICKLFQDPKFAGETLVIDGTGVGRGVVDIFREALGERTKCTRCDGTGYIDLKEGQYGVLVFEPQNLAATVATINGLAGTEVLSSQDGVTENGSGSGKYQCIRFRGSVDFVEFAVRKQGYAKIVSVFDVHMEDRLSCAFCKQGGVTRVNCNLMPVTITGGVGALGDVSVDDKGYWHVPKKELVSSVQVLLSSSRLNVAPGLRYGAVLVNELKSFTYKINAKTAHVSYEAWREAEHDDLVLGLALAAWCGEKAKQQLWIR